MPNYLDDNPMDLDDGEEVRDLVRRAGGDPMDVDTQGEAQFAWSILHSWEDDPPASRRNPAVLAAETEFVASELTEEYGVQIEEWPEIEDAPAWYDGRR